MGPFKILGVYSLNVFKIRLYANCRVWRQHVAPGPTTLRLPFWVYDLEPTASSLPPLAFGAEYPAHPLLRNQPLGRVSGCW